MASLLTFAEIRCLSFLLIYSAMCRKTSQILFHTVFQYSNHMRQKERTIRTSGNNIFIFTICLCLFSFSQNIDVSLAQSGLFPKLENGAENNPISTSPDFGTCGLNSNTGDTQRSAYCRSSTLQDSTQTCSLRYCIQDCPQRTLTPTVPDLLIGGQGACVSQDFLSTRPNTALGSSSFFFQNNPDCFISSNSDLTRLGNDGRFTLSAWIRPEFAGDGTLIERRSASNQIIYAIMVSSNSITFDYMTSGGPRFLVTQGGLQIGRWQHLAIQVFNSTVSFYLDGVEQDRTAFETQDLGGSIVDQTNAETRIGQRISGATQFIGRLQDLYFFQETLSNREIQELATGVFPELHIDSDCRCPDSYPRVNPADERYCIRNGDPDTTSNHQLRLNQYAHPLAFANDGDPSTYWVSSFTDDLILDVKLVTGQYQVFYVVLQFYSPLPRALSISRRKNDTSAWEIWQFFADDCTQQFGLPNNGPLPFSTSVNCLKFPSNPSNSKSNVTFQLLSPEPVSRPGYNDFFNTPDLLDFVLATQVRIRMQGHYYVTHPRHMYYGIEEITINTRCNCHGHASSCDMEVNPYQCDCLAESFTMGDQCQQCLPLYNDKPFRHGDRINAYNCKPCQCYGHASSCVYNDTVDLFPDDFFRGGGGVCVDCQHNTQGLNCDSCQDGFYRSSEKSLDAVDVCQPCLCNANGTTGDSSICEELDGQCSCKQHVTGRQCDECKFGYFNLGPIPDGCEPCSCNPAGSVSGSVDCDQLSGECDCKTNVRGEDCNVCNFGFFNLTSANPQGCNPCECDQDGSISQFCNPLDGQCQCQLSTQGRRCDECKDGFSKLRSGGCSLCDCDADGTEPGTVCDKVTGQCTCKANTQGRRCDQCEANNFNLQAVNPAGCSPCSCNFAGVVNDSSSCDVNTGQCTCKSSVVGRTCNQCVTGTFGLSINNTDGCLPCDCDAAGTVLTGNGQPVSCDQNFGQCACLPFRTGRRCDQCQLGQFLNPSGAGCLQCGCDPEGTVPGTLCSTVTGQCQCKGEGSGVTGRQCNTCLPDYFNYNALLGRCQLCNCDIRGSVNTTCGANTGQCDCKELVMGRRCDTCQSGSNNLQANNPQGCSKAPAQQPSPTWFTLNPFAILLTWGPPDEPNGNIDSYTVYRDNAGISTGLFGDTWDGIQQFEDRGLNPFTNYTYMIEATNEAGSAFSPTVMIQTPDAIPAGFDVLTISNIGSRTADFVWYKPLQISAAVSNYILTSVTPSKPSPATQHYTGLATSYYATDLIPFTNYTFTLTVCTPGSCGQGMPTITYTETAPPEGVMAPNVTALNESAVYAFWDHPIEANGIITHYELFIRGLPDENGFRDPPSSRIFNPSGWYNPRPILTPLEDPAYPPATDFTYGGLEAFTQYEFKLIVRNQVGTGASDWVTVRTLEAVPVYMPVPTVSAVSSSAQNVSWPQPADNEIRGFIIAYSLYKIVQSTDPFAPPETQKLLYTNDGEQRFFIVESLRPYQLSSFIVEACNSKGCVMSGRGSGRTLPAAPQNQPPPLADGHNATSMLISWNPPLQQNGPEPEYSLFRTAVAFSTPPLRVDRGARFTGSGYYKFPASTLPVSSFTGIEIDFRVSRLGSSGFPVNALLMFAASDSNQEEYIVVQLREGRPWFLFDPQGGAAGVTPADGGLTYDDGQWHKIRINRIGTLGSIVLDGIYTGTATARTSSNIIGETTGLYIGGLPTDFTLRRADVGNLAVISNGFAGCLRNVRIERQRAPVQVWEGINFNAAESKDNMLASWQGCPTQVQEGVHFLGNGYLALEPRIFIGGNSFRLELSFRSEYANGLIMLAYGQGDDFIVLQLVDGALQLSVKVRSRSIETKTSTQDQLCDGRWHTVSIVKTDIQVVMTIDGGTPLIMIVQSVQFQITSSFHLGGVAESIYFLDQNGINTQAFGGCIKDLTVNGASVSFLDTKYSVLNVHMDGCPPTVTPFSACVNPIRTRLYAGMDRNSYDHNREVFTDYLYQVSARNVAGSTISAWAVGKTREGAPTGVTPPIDPVSLTGYTIHVQWQRPMGNTGLLTYYIIMAYNEDIDVDPVQTMIYDTSLDENLGNVTDVIPFTNYTVTLTACTAGGCTESTGVQAVTIEEAPDGVQPPVATSVTGHSLMLAWVRPLRPNGIISNYRLTMNDQQIYEGSARNHLQTGLGVFTSYRFILSACTIEGCSDSSPVTLTTAQLPPSSVSPPTLFVQSPTSIEAGWTEPLQVNGILERYVLYMSTESGIAGDPVYNTSDLFTDYVIQQLIPGTRYYISVLACTGGGCTFSLQSSARTTESIPEGVQPPMILPTNSSQLDISWGPPEQPNGDIISYALFQNNVPVQNSTVMSATITGLSPWSLHIFRIEACTSVGCAYSPEVNGRTQEAPPVGTMDLTIFATSSRSVDALWTSPEQPNGQLVYEVLFTGLYYVDPESNNFNTLRETRPLFNTSRSNEVFSINGLIPNSQYTVRIKASNSKGSILSNERQITMPPGSPDGVIVPTLTPNGPTSILAVWSDPARNNAPGQALFLLTFRPKSSPGFQEELFANPTRATSFIKTSLQPYTEYQFRLTALNNFGRTESEWASAFTLEAVPGLVDPPMAAVISSDALRVMWEFPDRPNGIIRQVNLYQNNVLRINLPGNRTEYVATDLTPFTYYTFKVEICNNAGCTTSPDSVRYQTPQAPPIGQDPPTLQSDTPTSVIITWQPPTSPNGILIGYEVERRLSGSSAVRTVTSTGGSGPLRYRDNSPIISPYTSYEYRIRVSSSVGSFASLWMEITTRSAAPGGLRPPTLDVLGARSILVMWEPPAESNGLLQSYTIRMPQPRIYLDNTTTTSYVVDTLIPYTEYEVTIEACTIGGCTMSDSVYAQTNPDVPEGQSPPSGDPITQTYISVIWQPPNFPNGPSIRFGLHRQKIRQPLETGTVFGLNFWELIYNGTKTNFQDRSLTTFTTYFYRVTTYNTIGFVTSAPSEEITTLAGMPLKAGSITAQAVDHITVELQWTTPTLLELRGSAVGYYIIVNSTSETMTLQFPPEVNSTTLQYLTPNTLYEIVQVIYNGAYNISSMPTYAETLDGAPEGFNAPLVHTLSSTSVQVMWLSPDQPNGEILGYSIELDGSLIETIGNNQFSFILADLMPYTIYSVQVKVCTVYDCLLSNETIFTTLEVTPSGVSSPNLRVLGPSAIEIDWALPSQPNGIIRGFELLRRELKICGQGGAPDQNEDNTCAYLECSITENICGGQCYTGNKVCCNGFLHNFNQSYSCCGTNYLPIPAGGDAYTCCGGQFHNSRPFHQCCDGQYVEVPDDQICCADPSEDRVVVGMGDACCGGVPYDTDGPQICCGGAFYDQSRGLCCHSVFNSFDGTFNDGFNSKCCGTSIVSNNQVCCEMMGEGLAYDPDPQNVCCGVEYVDPSISLCCTSEGGFSRTHYYLSPEDKRSSNDQCCGVDKISSTYACCNGIGYNPSTHVCADRGSSAEGQCGTGVVCPVNQAALAYCNRCDFDPLVFVCGAVSVEFVTSQQPVTPTNVVSICPTALVSIYSTRPNQYTYLDLELSPFATYEYALSVNNNAGSATSELVNATTDESIPSGVQVPTWNVQPGVLDKIYLMWSAPLQPNGVIKTYILRRGSIEIFRGSATSFTDRNGIQPYQQYTYILLACTEVGCASSQEVIAATLEDVPENLADPVLVTLDPYTILISWQAPGRPNGIIKEYRIMQSGLEEAVYVGDVESFSFVHSDLDPFTVYDYVLVACTSAGCSSSNPVGTQTQEAPPQGVLPPTHLVYSAYIIEVYWSEPTTRNGILVGYKIYRNGQLACEENETVFMCVDTGLSPNTRYEYVLEASTNGGSTNSSVHVSQTPQSTPEGIPPPDLNVLSATSIEATWAIPTIPNGIIQQYGLVLLSGKQNQFSLFAGMVQSLNITGLIPYTLYDIRVLACNEGGCGVGPKNYERTLEAPPEGQGAPQLEATGSSVVEISWDPPVRPNGIIQNYYVYRRNFGTTQQLLVCLGNELETQCTNAGQGLEPFSLYEYKVRVQNNEGSIESPWESVRTLEAPPTGIGKPSVQAVSSFAVQVSWASPSFPNGLILGFRIEYQEESNDPIIINPVYTAATVRSSTLETTFYGLSPFTSYLVRIVAFNSAGESASAWTDVATLEGVPADIGTFNVEQNPDGLSLLLRWDVPGSSNGEITSYQIYEDVFLITPVYSGRTREYLFRRLTPFTEYTLVLEACTSAGCARGEPQTVITAETPPQNQGDPSLGFVNATTVQLVWKPPVTPNGQITRYDVIRRTAQVITSQQRRRRRDTDDSLFTETQVVHTVYNTNAASFSYMDYSLRPYSLYEYKIRAVNSKGGIESDWVSVQTLQAPPTGVLPPVLSHIPNTPGSVLITWSPPGEANGVLSGYRLNRNGSTSLSFDVDENQMFADTGLEPFTFYSYTITVCSGGGCTASEASSIRTLEAAPVFVPPPSPVAISSTEILVNWTTPSLSRGDIIDVRLKVDGEIEFMNLMSDVTLRGLTPYQEYEFILIACTSGGCSESQPAYKRPFEAPPEGMDSPSLRVLSPRTVEASWSEPNFPNGVIKRYELRRDGKLVYDGAAQRFQDFGDGGAGLTPGQEYSYIVTAINSQGRTISAPSFVTTSADTPAGLSPPTLTPTSSTSIRAIWQPPLFPNGEIQNYTLFLDDRRVYSGRLFSFDVRNLGYFSEHTFYVESCTQSGCAQSDAVSDRTHEHSPSGQLAPTLTPLADNIGVASGILAEWALPSSPNGIVMGYQLYRRRVFRQTGLRSEPTRLYNGTLTSYRDLDEELIPDESYEYMVMSFNSVGQTSSSWAVTRMLEAPPEGLRAPIIEDVRSTSVTIVVQEPSLPNGVISAYNIYRNGTQIVTTTSTEYQDPDLNPFTTYTYAVQACTSGGCARSDDVTVKTRQDNPAGLTAPRVVKIDSTWIYLEWDYPFESNGIISRFEVLVRPSCPYTQQPFEQPCQDDSFDIIQKGLSQSHNMTDLLPYTMYDFVVRVINAEGAADSPMTTTATSDAAPRVYPGRDPVIISNATAETVQINWSRTFILNGQLRRFKLIENGDEVYNGIASVATRPLRYMDYEFAVTCMTSGGEVSFNLLYTPAGTGTTGQIVTAWYESVWFISIVILIGIVILFILLGVCLSRIAPTKPYQRERRPLPARQKRAHNFTFASSCKYPDSESILDPIPKSISRGSSMHSLHNGFINPSFVQMPPGSRPVSRGSEDKTPLKYLSDDDIGWENPSPIPLKLDSGMYDDEVMTNGSQSYSFTKEQTMFTDTHL